MGSSWTGEPNFYGSLLSFVSWAASQELHFGFCMGHWIINNVGGNRHGFLGVCFALRTNVYMGSDGYH